MDIKTALDRIDFNEDRIREVLSELNKLRNEIIIDSGSVDEFVIKLLESERFRMQVALTKSKNKISACKLLNMNERTFYRKLKEYQL